MCEKKPLLPCDSCKRIMSGRVYSYRNAPKNGFCKTCYAALPKVKCLTCSKFHRTIQQENFECSNCKTKARKCVHCNESAYLGGRIIDGNPVCAKCVNRLLVTRPCTVCHKDFKGSADWQEDRPVCSACQTRIKKARPCAHCGTYSLFTNSDAKVGIHEAICISCRKNARITCAICHKSRKPAALNKDGKKVCKDCHKHASSPFICPQCGCEGVKHSKSQCENCYWRSYTIKRMVSCQSLLNHTWAKDLFADFLQSLSDTHIPHYVAMHVEKYFPFFAAIDVTFDTCNELDSYVLLKQFSPDGLRRFTIPYDYLAKSGIIKPLTRTEIASEQETRSQSKLIIQTEGCWYQKDMISFYEHLQELSKRYKDRGWKDKAKYKPRTITGALRAALLFYQHATQCGIIENRQIHQAVIDEFIDNNPGYKQALRTLLSYLKKHEKLFRRLKIECPNPAIPKDAFIPPSKYGELLRQWLSAEGTDTKKAIIGFLMLMYAQPATRIVRLRIEDLQKNSNGAYKLAFGTSEIALDMRISEVLNRYLISRDELLATRGEPENNWLFPGRKYDCHVTTASITELIHNFGVSSDQMFATAIFNAYQTGMQQPKVLVNAFGITSVTAIKYLKLIDPRMFDEVKSLGLQRAL